MLSERDPGRVACVGQRQHLAIDEQGVAADLDGAIAAAWMESYLIWRARYSALLDALTSFALTSGSLMAPWVMASGAGQLVVQDALDTTELSG